jgi:hypothetical protein
MDRSETPRRASLLAYLVPRLDDVVFVAVLLGVVGLGPSLLNGDGDLGRHLTLGRYILENHVIPTRDVFSHTLAGQPLAPHEWLSEVLFALSYRIAHLDGVVWLCAVLIATTFAVLYRHAVRRSGSRVLSLAFVLLAVGATRLHWLARPHLFTMLMVVVWTDGLERLRTGRLRRWWLLPILMLLWANLHGGFIAGFLIWAAYGAGYLWERWKETGGGSTAPPGLGRRLVNVGVASLLVSFLNPVGWRVWTTLLGFVGNRYLVSHTVEYLPPDLREPGSWPFLVMIALSAVLLPRIRKHLPPAWVLLLAGWTALGLFGARNIPLYALVATPILAEAAGGRRRGDVDARGVWGLEARLAATEASLRGHLWPMLATLLLALVLASGVPADFAGQGNRFDPSAFPVEAVDWIEANPVQGRVFNYFTWGGYLLYRLWPRETVFIDGQTDFYGEALTREYENVLELEDGWRDVLRRYRVDWVLMPASSKLALALKSDPGWRLAHEDSTADVLVRASPLR